MGVGLRIVQDLGTRLEGSTTRRWCLAECPYCLEVKEFRTQQALKNKSCGCNTKLKGRTKHGMHDSRLYQTWADMKNRCFSSNNARYHRYGGRGITVCEEWLDFIPFMYWAISAHYNDTLTIDRINNDKGYSPDNCEWVTIQENIRRRDTWK